jgi:hypothetical protein
VTDDLYRAAAAVAGVVCGVVVVVALLYSAQALAMLR